MHTDDTIVAISTPPGRGGIGVVRLSGPDSVSIALEILEHRDEALDLKLAPWEISYAVLKDDEGAPVDRVLVSFFEKPLSYTAENVVEISCHGSPVVLQYLVSRCLDHGARLAEPGEFTMRAFLNGRIDLPQAEAVRDLIEARTLYQARIAASQMDGSISHRISPVKKQLVDLIALLEAGIDFGDDDVSVLSTEEIFPWIKPVQEELDKLAKSFATGKVVHEGLTLAIVGRPNVGKSSLFNSLLRQDRAIVTASPGTTRDLVAETVEIDGVPLRFIDTAGVRNAVDEAESIGVRKSYEASADSDLTILVLNGAEGLVPEDRTLLGRLYPRGKLLIAINKIDLPQRLQRYDLEMGLTGIVGEEALDLEPATVPIVLVSALTKEGIDELRRAILNLAIPSRGETGESVMLTNVRHMRMIMESADSLSRARQALESGVPHEMLLLDLYAALRPLDALTGTTSVEDILGNIFSNFCIGK